MDKDFSGFSEEGDIYIGDFFPLFTVGGGEVAVHGDRKVGDGVAFGGVFDFGVAGEVPDDHYFVERGHERRWLGSGEGGG